MKIPQKITPCPIIEAVVEIRFKSKLPSDAIFGIIYNEFKNDYKTLQKLPILQLPEEVRSKDPNLKYQPYYKLITDNFILQIGPHILSLVNIGSYVGWQKFFEKIIETFSRINKLAIISKINRLGIRYINFFELNIFEKINLKFYLSDNTFSAQQITFKSTINTGKFLSNLQILNNGIITVNNLQKTGSVIDIDTYTQNENKDIFSTLTNLLNEGHLEEKKLFFTLLTDSFLKNLNPEY